MLFEKTRTLLLRRSLILFVLLLLLLFSLSLSTCVAQAATVFKTAPVNPDFTAYIKAHDLNQVKNQTGSGHRLGHIPAPLDLSHLKGKKTSRLTSFPSSYDLRDLGKLTPVKDQGACGSCWAFATYASLESYLLPLEKRDFSENNMKNTHGFDWRPCGGGNQLIATAYLARWSGPIDEAGDPYSPYDGTSPTGLPPEKHVQHAYFIPDRSGPLDNDGIKQALMDYGAVFTSMYYNDNYYNSNHYTYYYDGSSYSNHAVAIVGWDDNFDRNLFPTPPPGDGAFIIKNSWGTGWGESGYFYLSYYDSNAGKDNVVFTAEAPANYHDIYQYDPYGWINSIGDGDSSIWFANVFNARDSGSLAAVSFYTAAPNSVYELYIYQDVAGTPESGTLAATQTGTLFYPGYNTIKLDTPVSLSPGQKYSVTVKLTTPGFNYPCPVESTRYGYDSNAASNPGESWASSDGATWQDLYGPGHGNVCLKAFTTAPTGPSITVTSPDGGERWKAGSTQTVSWTYTGDPGSQVKIELLKGGALDSVITAGTSTGSGGSGSYTWTVPETQAPGDDYAVRITSTSASFYYDISNDNFTIRGINEKVVLFIHDGSENNNKISNTSDYGYSTVKTILENETGLTVEEQNLSPITLSSLSDYHIVVFGSMLANREITQSEADALVTYVNQGGNLFLVGEFNYSTKWYNSFNKVGTSFNVLSDFNMITDPTDYYQNQNWPVVSEVQPHDVTGGVRQFVLPSASSLTVADPASAIAGTDQDANPAGASVLAVLETGTGRIVAAGDSNFLDNRFMSLYDNRILAGNIFSWLLEAQTGSSITVTAPNGGESWTAGTAQTVNWTYAGDPGSQVKIELLRSGALDSVITTGTSTGSGGSGSYTWTVPANQDPGNDYAVRVTSTSASSCSDTSDNYFTVVTASEITVGFDPAQITVYKNPVNPYSDEFMIGVKISGLTAGQEILSFHDKVSFDPGLLEVVKVELPANSFLNPVLYTGTEIDNATGQIDFNLARSDTAYPGSTGTVYKITMRAKNEGTATLQHSPADLRDGQNRTLAVDTSTAVVNISSITGDFTGDGTIDSNDLEIFSACWKHKTGDIGWNENLPGLPGSPFKQADIGPAAGAPPGLIIEPDGKVDFEDLSIFAWMWNWARSNTAGPTVPGHYPAALVAPPAVGVIPAGLEHYKYHSN